VIPRGQERRALVPDAYYTEITQLALQSSLSCEYMIYLRNCGAASATIPPVLGSLKRATFLPSGCLYYPSGRFPLDPKQPVATHIRWSIECDE
jgi:hypothetical protein